MHPTIIEIESIHTIGMEQITNFSQQNAHLLWMSFMPRKKEIASPLNALLYSIQIYPKNFFSIYNPNLDFTRRTGVAVDHTENIPLGMTVFTIPAGKYACFHYVGGEQQIANFFNKIFQEWLPESGYELDNRPFFEILDHRYKRGSEESEEDIYIPIK